MSSHDRRVNARRRAWGRGPSILQFEPLEGRQLLSGNNPLAALASTVATASASTTTSGSTTPIDSSAAVTPVTATVTPITSTSPTMTKPIIAAAVDHSILIATQFNTAHNLDWGDTFHAIGRVQNQGTGPNLSSSHIDVYASAKPTLDTNAVLLGSVPIPSGIAAGTSSDFDEVLTAPRAPFSNLGSAPSYYIIPKLVIEGSPKASSPSLVTPILNSVVTISPKVPPKLVAAGISVSPGKVSWGDTISVTASVSNQSQGIAPPTNARIVLTPVGKTPGGSADYQIGQVPIPPVGGYQSAKATQTIVLPKYVPTSLVGVSQFTVTLIPDADAAANTLISTSVGTSSANTTTLVIGTPAATIVVATPPAADLTVTKVSEPSPTMFRGATFAVGATIQNNGPGDAGAFKVRFLLVTDSSAPALVLGDSSLSGLAAGTEQDVYQTVTLPYRTPDGFSADSPTAHILVQVDPDRSIDQSNTTNDSLAAPTVQLRVLTADGQTTVPILPVITPTTPTPTPTKTMTTPTTVSTTTTTTTTTTTPIPTTSVSTVVANPTNVSARQAALLAKQHHAAAMKAASKNPSTPKVHTQVVASKAHFAVKARAVPRAHLLKVFNPSTKVK